MVVPSVSTVFRFTLCRLVVVIAFVLLRFSTEARNTRFCSQHRCLATFAYNCATLRDAMKHAGSVRPEVCFAHYLYIVIRITFAQ